MFHSTVHLLWNFPAFCRHSPKDSRFIQSTENCELTDSQISFFGPHKGSFWCVVYITGLVLEIRHCFPTIENPFKWIHVCETIKQIFLRHAIELWPMKIFSFNQNFGQKTVIIKKNVLSCTWNGQICRVSCLQHFAAVDAHALRNAILWAILQRWWRVVKLVTAAEKFLVKMASIAVGPLQINRQLVEKLQK